MGNKPSYFQNYILQLATAAPIHGRFTAGAVPYRAQHGSMDIAIAHYRAAVTIFQTIQTIRSVYPTVSAMSDSESSHFAWKLFPPSYNETGKVADYSENIFWPKQNVKLNGMTMSSLQAHLARRESVREKTIKGTSWIQIFAYVHSYTL